MIEMTKRIIMNRGHTVVNALMATGIIPCILSLLFIAVFDAFKYDSGTVYAYFITTAILITLYILKLCNPLTMAIGHVILFLTLVPALTPLPIEFGYNVFFYSMFMIITTIIAAVFYYIFGYKEKTPTSNKFLVVFTILVIPGWIVMFNFPIKLMLIPNPPKPRITYGEFPFTLVYEINGEEMIIEDILVCEYDGVSIYGDSWKENSWKSSLRSGGKRIILLQIDEEWELHYGTPGATTLMDSAEAAAEGWNYFSKEAMLRDKSLNDSVGGDRVNEEELLSKYGIKIVSWYIAPPIDNM